MSLQAIFKFRKRSLSLFLIVTYSIIALIFLYDQARFKHSLPNEKEQRDLLNNAWTDLQNITNKCHPYGSRDNDRVHDYLLERVKYIINSTVYADVSDDYENKAVSLFKQRDVFNASSTASRIIYFESSNILVRVNGKNSNLPALLLSAHYDSVPTSHGATDDGKGIVSILALLVHFSKKQPERTVIFNFNNNEEFGLLGATAFFKHPWSKEVDYFINLEGTGTGINGKAVLFRTSDISTAKIYEESVIEAPFGNSIYQQGFYSRLIRSETDYKVYEQHGLRGWDIAFYKPRSLYHTIKDSIEYTSKEALWNMLHTSWQLAEFIANSDANNLGDEKILTPAVYFDLSSFYMISYSAQGLFWFNVIIIIVMPIINLFLFSLVRRSNKKMSSSKIDWFKLPFSLVVSITILIATTRVISILNPFILSSNFILPMIALSLEFLLINYFILSIFDSISPTFDFKTIAINEISFILWIILIMETFKLYQSDYKNTGIYPLTIVYVFYAIVGNLGYLFMIFKKINTDTNSESSSEGECVNHESENTSSREINSGINSTEDDNSDERQPLIRTTSQPNEVLSNYSVKYENEFVYNYDWSIQFLVLVPISTYLFFNSFELIMEGLNQTIQETGNIANVYKLLTIGCILITLPTIPFTYKLNCKTVASMLIAALIIFTEVVLIMNPFTEINPLKFKFIQVNDQVEISGIRYQNILYDMISDLPSVKNEKLEINCEKIGLFHEKCRYQALHSEYVDNYFSVQVIKNDKKNINKSPYEPINAVVRINVIENRMCTMFFNTTTKVREVSISNGNSTLNYKNADGIDELQLHKLNFEQPFYQVGIQWLPKLLVSEGGDDDDENNSHSYEDNSLTVSIECYWTEYDYVPSLIELIEYKPVDISISNREKGLIKFTKRLEL